MLNKRYIWSTNVLSYIHHSFINSSTLKSILFPPLYLTGSTVTNLQQARVNIISNYLCNAPAGYNGAVLSGMLCAGVPEGGVDACQVSSRQPYPCHVQVYKHLLACLTMIDIIVVVVLVAPLCATLCDPMDCSLPGSFCPWDSPGKNAGVDCHGLLQGIFAAQGLNSRLLHLLHRQAS